jgi:hypothetical protein
MKIELVRDHGVQLEENQPGRAEGVHVSDLYNAFYRATKPGRYNSEVEPGVEFRALGLAWEQYLEKQLLASGIEARRPGQFTVTTPTGQPVSFNPDLYITDGKTERGGEMKLTWMSANEDFTDPKFDKYHTQAKCYGHHLQLPDWTFYVMHVLGNGKGRRDPVFRQFNVSYSRREMEEEWRAMMGFGQQTRILR